MNGSYNLQSKRVLLLFTTTGYQAGSFRQAAEKLGVTIVAGSDRCKNLDDPWRDGAIPLKFQNPEAAAENIVKAARQHPYDAILAIGDKPTLTAALASEALGLLGSPVSSVRACRDKFQFRERLRAIGLPGPAYMRLPASSDPEEAVETAAHIGFPCVLKPLCLSASRGVIRADDAQQFTSAFRRVRDLLQTPDIRLLKDEAAEWIQIESFLTGCEVAVEGLVTRGQLKLLAIFDKPDPLDGPYFEETIYVTPSRLPVRVQAELTYALENAIQAVGLQHGPIHGEVRLTPGGPVVLEIAARPIGGLCSKALRFDGGLSLEELLIRHALGAPVNSIEREHAAAGVMMIPVPAEGILEAIRGEEEASRVADVQEIRITAKLHQRLVPWPEGSSYLGFIFARSERPEEVESSLRLAHAKLQFAISPALPVLR
ncbi:MAG: ATP-grasp domain-containing protein [Acidobacteria bacterium]|nr:ATP-grasp domain-containing protein [Acidobacteriota bacterium]